MKLPGNLRARFDDLPIRRKLRIIFVLTTASALLLAGFGIIAADSVMFYNYLRRDLATVVKIVGDNSTGALAFDDAKAAAETLAALRARSHVEIACLYQSTGALLAKYTRLNFHGSCPAPPQAEQVRFEHGVLVASHQIRLSGRPLGVFVLQYDLDEIAARVEVYGATVLAALLLSCIVTLAFSSKLRALIAEPILELANVARSVSQSKDYSIRTAMRSQDELGTLADALNQMMDGIQSRDNELHKAIQDQREALNLLAQANADLKRSNTELARSNSDLERFAFMASHDLQEPLRMITSYSQLLVAEYFRENEGRPSEAVNYIAGGTKRMRELLADLLAYSELAGSVEQPFELVDLNGVVHGIRQDLRMIIEETQAEIVAGQLPVMVAHQSHMVSLFQNLVENAIKYRSRNPPRIQILFDDDNDQYTFAVMDNGIGIERDYHDKIFVAFQRLHGKDIPGTGIGLAICQRVVERYGGRIWVESEFGAGSTFRFILPKSMSKKASA
jgi:signal transduction histidine kinase